MKIELIELYEVQVPLVTPFRTSFGTMHSKDTFLLHVVADGADGWSEFAGDPEPLYCSEFIAAAEIVLAEHLVPRVLALPEVTAAAVGPATAAVKGHPMAKAALETALLDAELRAHGMAIGTFLGAVRDRVPAGVSVGIKDTIPSLLDDVEGYLAAGYQRITCAGSTSSTCCSSSSRWTRTTCSATPSSRSGCALRSAWTSRSPARGTPPPRSSCGPAA